MKSPCLRRFLTGFVACGLMVLARTPEPAVVAGQESQAQAKVVGVPHCTISLIDQVVLAADRPGVLGKVLFEEGQDVPAETLVVQLANDEARARYELARKTAANDIAIRLAEATRGVAEAELLQAQELNREQEVYTEFEMRRLKLTLDKTALERDQAVYDQQLKVQEQDVALAQLEKHDVTSTFAGTVVRVFKKRGEAVREGDPLMEIVSDRRLRVEGYIPVSQISELRAGQTVQVMINDASDGEPRQLEGTLKFIDVSVQSVTQEVRVWAEVENKDHLFKPGQIATMTIFVE